MAYLAIARRWRPTRFEDLVGQMHVVQTLKNSIASNRVSHAYLFSGARGVGKTSVARIFAKALRCPQAKDAVPCNTCPECVAISESRSVDVAEIDGASHNGVEAVRSIRDNVAYSASSGFYKIYIIDEAHMLSLSAFNALLKTLEEPPAHVIFVLATTESQKIPVTILSRCQRFEFRRLSQSQIVDRLKHILSSEKVALSEEAMRTIASHADGSLRDALSLLDQVLSHDAATENLTEAQIVHALGISPTSAITGFWKAVIQKEIPAILSVLNSAHAAGVDLKHFGEKCLEELRLLYLIKLSEEAKSPVDAETLDIASSHFQTLQALSSHAHRVSLERMAQILTQAIGQLSWASLPRFVLEMAAVRMAQLEPLALLESALSGKTVPSLSVAKPTVAPSPRPLKTLSPRPTGPNLEAESESAAPEAPAVANTPPPIAPATMAPRPVPMNTAPTPSGPHWQGFIDTVMKKRPLLGALLCHGEFRMEAGKKVTLAFPESSFYERQARDTKNRNDIEEFLKTFFGKEATLEITSGEASSLQSLEKSRQDETSRIKKEALEHPAVIQMQQALGAEVVDISVES
jgi:DNA polymerase III subunit gamma/tau